MKTTIGFLVSALLLLSAQTAFAGEGEEPVSQTTPPPAETGLHLAAGGGVGSDGGNVGPTSQLKIGSRVSTKTRVFFESLAFSYRYGLEGIQAAPGTSSSIPTQQRLTMWNGIGADYFVHPRIGLRGGVGLTTDAPIEFNQRVSFGGGAIVGASIVIFEGVSSMSVDPTFTLFVDDGSIRTRSTEAKADVRAIAGLAITWTYR